MKKRLTNAVNQFTDFTLFVLLFTLLFIIVFNTRRSSQINATESNSSRSSSTETIAPTPFPTSVVGLPVGTKLVFSEVTQKGLVIWAASASQPDLRAIVKILENPPTSYNISISHSQNKIAIISSNSGSQRHSAHLSIITIGQDVITDVELDASLGRYINYPSWSSDDKYVSILQQSASAPPYSQALYIVDTETGVAKNVIKSEVENLKDEETIAIYPLDWSTDGKYLYYQVGLFDNVNLWRVDIVSGESNEVANISSSGIPRCYALSKDGHYLSCLVSSKDFSTYSLRIISTLSGENRILSDNIGSDGFSDPIWNPNGQELALTIPNAETQKADLSIFNVETGQQLKVEVSDQESAIPIVWSADSEWLLIQLSKPGQPYLLYNTQQETFSEITLPFGATIIGWTMMDLFTTE